MARSSNTSGKKKAPLPAFAGSIAKRFPDVWHAYTKLGEATAEAGPLSERERRLVKLALAIGSGSEGATHSHARQALAEGLNADEIRHIGLHHDRMAGERGSAELARRYSAEMIEVCHVVLV